VERPAEPRRQWAQPPPRTDGFASLIIQEIDQFVVDPGWDQGGKQDLYLALQPSLR
jgi:hypothetical protein